MLQTIRTQSVKSIWFYLYTVEFTWNSLWSLHFYMLSGLVIGLLFFIDVILLHYICDTIYFLEWYCFIFNWCREWWANNNEWIVCFILQNDTVSSLVTGLLNRFLVYTNYFTYHCLRIWTKSNKLEDEAS